MKPLSGDNGNGTGGFSIHSQDMGGWVRVYTDRPVTAPGDLGLYLSLTLADWFRRNPALRLRCVAPIDRDGSTVELHAWYDAHGFPPTAACPQPTQHD